MGEFYIGVGPSAHSYNGNERQWNIKNNNIYIDKINRGENYFEIEELTATNKYNEYVLTRLRTIWGCNALEMEKLFGKEKTNYFHDKIQKQQQFVIEKNGVYTLNDSGKLRADGIASHLFF